MSAADRSHRRPASAPGASCGSTWPLLRRWVGYLCCTDRQELGLPISDKAIEQMKANLELDEAQFKVAAEEERKRRREC